VNLSFYWYTLRYTGHVVEKLLKALRYKPVARGFVSGRGPELIPVAVLGSTQPLIEMSSRNISLKVKAVGAKSWQLVTFR